MWLRHPHRIAVVGLPDLSLNTAPFLLSLVLFTAGLQVPRGISVGWSDDRPPC